MNRSIVCRSPLCAQAVLPAPLPPCCRRLQSHRGGAARRADVRRGFTLIEMLVSLTITMIMMLAVVTLFQVMTDSVSGSRALLETADRLRACRNRLQADLQGATATMTPPLRPESDEGYLEIGEGQYTDSNNVQSGITPLPAGATLYGDTDDYLAFTTRSRGEPFVGKLASSPTLTAESQTAEVIYYLAQSGTEPIMDATQATPTRLYTLYRRVRLVSPGSGPISGADDISQRTVGGMQIGNSLGDLTKPENRFNHAGVGAGGSFPFRMALPMAGFGGVRIGDDILLTNVLAFDVQVYDQTAPIFTAGGVALEPRDNGYAAQVASYTIVATQPVGAYVDLGYFPSYALAHSGQDLSLFSGYPNTKSGIPNARTATSPYVYDTWSLHYENDGVLQLSPIGTADTGTNGLDDDSLNGVDDIGEFDTLPPYSAQLRGIRVVIRVYEPSSQQVREVTVMQDFLPE